MAVGGGGSSKFGNSTRGRPYAMMLLLAFGAAVFGVMMLHKLRERRIFNLLIKDKDRDIITLELLLQKERDYTKEVKRKIEELKAKTYSLRTQKMELNNKLMDMHSTAVSLKEEVRALEAELEKKRNEIKMLKEKEMNSSQENSQVAALTELLKQKETEIDDMKRRLEDPINVWSVSTDDPSNPSVNLSATEKSVNAKDSESVTTKTEGEGQLQKFENKRDSEGSEDGDKNGEEGQGRGEVSGEKRVEKSEAFQDDEVLRMRGKEGNNNEKEVVESSRDDDALKTKDENGDLKTVDGKEDEISRNQQVENFENFRYGEGRLLGMISKDGRKMEVSDGSHIVESSRDRGDEDGDKSKTENKRWRVIYRNRELEKTGNSEEEPEELQKNESSQDHKTGLGMDDEVLGMGTDNGDRAGLEGTEDGVVSSEEKLNTVENSGDSEGFRMRGENGERRGLYGRNQEETAIDGYQLLKPQKTEDDEDLGINITTAESNQQLGKEGEKVPKDAQSEKPKESQDVHSVSDNFGRVAIDDLEHKPNLALRQPKEQEGNGVQKPIQRRLPITHSMVLKRQRLPILTKGRKTSKSSVLANNPGN